MEQSASSFRPPSPPFGLDMAVARFNLKSPQLTASTAALILAGASNWASQADKQMLIDGVAAAIAQANGIMPCVPINSPERRDSRPYKGGDEGEEGKKIIIHSDYAALRSITTENSSSTLPQIEFTDNPELATHWFHIAQTKNFLAVPPSITINQFPYEGGFVRKDLLPLTIRRHAYDIPGDPRSAPSWWLGCFDLSTEFHLFSEEFNRVKGLNESREVGISPLGNRWVIKESQGTHSQGSKVVSTLKEASDYVSSEDNSKREYVAQELVENPLLVNGRKFDIRVWIFVRSFGNKPSEFEAYMSKFFHARVSNKKYDAGELDDDEVFFTVSSYNNEVEDGVRYTPSRLREKLLEDDKDFDFEALVDSVVKLARELFRSLAKSVGQWPRSTAYYGIDVIISKDKDNCRGGFKSSLLEVNYGGDFESARESQRQAAEDEILNPKLLEINYAGDIEELEKVAQQNVKEDEFLQWGDDLANVLFTTCDLSANDRLIRL